MKKKIKDLTIEDMINVCESHKNESCLNCQLLHVCARTPYDIKVMEDPNKEIDL